jgi:hypothetical protein
MLEQTLDCNNDDEGNVLFERLQNSGYFRILIDRLVPHVRGLTGDAEIVFCATSVRSSRSVLLMRSAAAPS